MPPANSPRRRRLVQPDHGLMQHVNRQRVRPKRMRWNMPRARIAAYTSAGLGRMDTLLDRRHLVALAHQLVKRAEVGFGRSDKRVGIGTPGGEGAAALREPDRNLRLGVGTPGHRVYLIELKRRIVRDQRAYRLEDRVHRTVAGRLRGDMLSVDVERERRGLRAHSAGDDG